MSDRELLELAAKAAGWSAWDWLASDEYLNVYSADGRHDTFAPLTDDGDALRLAVKLGIQIRQYPIYDQPRFAVLACEAKWDSDAQRAAGAEALEHYEGDPYTATRRAIVRAAAEIGKTC